MVFSFNYNTLQFIFFFFLMSWRQKPILSTQINTSNHPNYCIQREMDFVVSYSRWVLFLFTVHPLHAWRWWGWGLLGGVMAADTNVPTLPPRDWAPYIQPSNPLLHKTTTATQAGLLSVARQQAPEPHRRVSPGRGCTWKCSNGSARTKEKRQTGRTEKRKEKKKH